MFRLEPRPQASRWWSYGSPLLALAVTVLSGIALFAALGKDPLPSLVVTFGLSIVIQNALMEAVSADPRSIVRIPLMADSDSISIADSVPGDGGHVARVS